MPRTGSSSTCPCFPFQLLDEDLAAVGRAVARPERALLPRGDQPRGAQGMRPRWEVCTEMDGPRPDKTGR